MEVVRQLPPGFRFHPTDEELVVQYLRRKALSRPLPAAVIPVVHDAGELDPWDLPGASEGEETYFFSLRRRAAPAARGGGWRRKAGSGYWKATGKEKPVFLHGCGSGSKRMLLVGVKTALAFHRAKPSPSPSSRTGWVMHEYRLAAPGTAPAKKSGHQSSVAQAEEWVVCRIFLKNKPTRRHHGEVDGQTPGSSGAAHSDVHRSPLHRPEDAGVPPSSTSSCVTGISDEDEVSSGSISRATVASQRETGGC